MHSTSTGTLASLPYSSAADWGTDGPDRYAGPLNTMPQDVFCSILCQLSINDITCLAATNFLTYATYITRPVANTTLPSWRDMIITMQSARANKNDATATMHALTCITFQDVRMRPGLLTQLAQGLFGIAAIPDAPVTKAWATACEEAHTAWQRCFSTEMPAEPSYYLEVADWQVRFSTDRETQKIANNAALQRMVVQPPVRWLALMEAFVVREIPIPANVVARFVDTFQGCLAGISDPFATKLVTALFDDEKRNDIKNTVCRLGISERQLRGIVLPRVAESVADTILRGQGSRTSASNRWDRDDNDFDYLLTSAYQRRLALDSDDSESY